ncbi:MAG: FKBP-type peptidyl-prolyl cis-trans isomerase [Paludibacteraceae bacterium]|nr:FKBP-type peptidyl-prolyl cis-trans isomerase [Paludibacteraceae bacterium]
MQKLLIGICVGMLVAGCGRTQPQRPTFLHEEPATDTTVLQTITMNQRMAEEADRQLIRYAEGYVLLEENVWVKGLDEATQPLTENELVSLHARFYSLDSVLLEDHQHEVTVGRIEDIQGIVSVVNKMERGDSVSLLVPWYEAFGSAGNGQVPPYENLRVELTIQ